MPRSGGMLISGRAAGSNSTAQLSTLERIASIFLNGKIQALSCFPMMWNTRILRKLLRLYLSQARRVWDHLPDSVRHRPLGRAYGRHVHALVRLHAERSQYFATYFLRNRVELELMRRLADKKAHGSSLTIAVLACSKGAEVYSIVWAIRSARPDLRLNIHAVDISQEIVDFAEEGVYSLTSFEAFKALNQDAARERGSVIWNTCREQLSSMFERMTKEEVAAMFEVEGDQARIKSWLKEGITWRRGDAGDAQLVGALGPQEIVVANRFLCHMTPAAAEKCLRNIGQLVKPGGYLFVSGIDLDVRTRVAREMGWTPVSDLMREIHEGDPSLECGWPLDYWGLEPFCAARSDSGLRYASVFQFRGDGLNSSDPLSSAGDREGKRGRNG